MSDALVTPPTESLVEEPYDVAKTFAQFEESNRLYPPA